MHYKNRRHSLPCLSEITPRASGVSNWYTAALALMRIPSPLERRMPGYTHPSCRPIPLGRRQGKGLPLQQGGPRFGRLAQRRGMKGRRVSAPRRRAETSFLLFRVPTATPLLQANLLFEKLGRPRRSPPGPALTLSKNQTSLDCPMFRNRQYCCRCGILSLRPKCRCPA